MPGLAASQPGRSSRFQRLMQIDNSAWLPRVTVPLSVAGERLQRTDDSDIGIAPILEPKLA